MINLFGEDVPERKRDAKREAWNRRFQKWSDESRLDETTSAGVCGFGYICGWCKDNTYGRPCVRALNAMLWEKHVKIDYDTVDFEDVFYGNLTERRECDAHERTRKADM